MQQISLATAIREIINDVRDGLEVILNWPTKLQLRNIPGATINDGAVTGSGEEELAVSVVSLFAVR